MSATCKQNKDGYICGVVKGKDDEKSKELLTKNKKLKENSELKEFIEENMYKFKTLYSELEEKYSNLENTYRHLLKENKRLNKLTGYSE